MSRAHELRAALEEARAYTLSLLQNVDDVDFTRQAHADFSPLGWHLGHIGVTESFWILHQCQQQPTLSSVYDHFFTPTDNPKPKRSELPPRTEILAYLETVRGRVLSFLDRTDFEADHPLLRHGGIFHMLLQHEAQHNETMLLIKHILAADRCERVSSFVTWEGEVWDETLSQMAFIPAGSFLMGSDDRATTLDNERPRHEQWVDAFVIDRFPVTNAEYARFIESGGYHQRALWSDAGWQWREQEAVAWPLYWRRLADGWCEIDAGGVHALAPEQAVMCVSWYEADAYARFVGKRLPTETEWERAATLHLLEQQGNVWEWTSTWFAPYPGFAPHPYEGYSIPYFDGRHRVLRGGSWATRSQVKRTTFRNWYQPWVREIFAGLRCARSA